MFNLSHLRLNHAKIMNWKNEIGELQARVEALSDPPQVEYYWESSLDNFEPPERIFFLVAFCAVTAFGVIGNVLTIYVIFAR